jgi:hypothetical protein
MLVYTDEGLAAARSWLDRTKLKDNDRFSALVRAAIYAVPRLKAKGAFVVDEAATLESIRTTLFDATIPAPKEDAEQLVLV